MQAIRRAEKALIYTEFKDRVGDIVSGEVRGFDRSDVLVDLGKFEALLPNRERVPTEEYQRGERIRCLVKAVEGSDSSSEIILSRRDSDFVIKLFSARSFGDQRRHHRGQGHRQGTGLSHQTRGTLARR